MYPIYISFNVSIILAILLLLEMSSNKIKIDPNGP